MEGVNDGYGEQLSHLPGKEVDGGRGVNVYEIEFLTLEFGNQR